VPPRDVHPLTFQSLTIASFQNETPCLQLQSNSIQVWPFSLQTSPDVIVHCTQLLSPEEQARAARFKFEKDRQQFLVAHGYLRYILSRYCGVKPADVVLGTIEGGKPVLLTQRMPGGEMTFNLTHSKERGMIAIAKDFPVGVDLEPVRQDVEHLKLAERFFSPAESRAIAGSEPAMRQAMFFRHWVGKEAFLKAKGIGLRVSLDRCELAWSEAGDEAMVHWREERSAEAWRIQFIPLESGWIGAVAALGSDWTVALADIRQLTG
jgi:4'-phosphopantetheinyl transferase